MTVQQISIFLENKFGRLNEILSVIAKENVRIIAATVADTSEFGILRIICTDPETAFNALKKTRISANICEVYAVVTESKPGQFAQTIEYFTMAGISIEYMYSFSTRDKAALIFRTNNVDLVSEVIEKYQLQTISNTELAEF